MKTLIKRTLCIMLALALCLICFAGCGPKAETKTTEIVEDTDFYEADDENESSEGGTTTSSTTSKTTKGDTTVTTPVDNGKTDSKPSGGNKDITSNDITGNGTAGTVKMDENLAKKLRGTTVKLLWWHDFTDTEKSVIKKFEKDTGMKVDYKFSSNDAEPYTELLASSMAGKEGYDVAMFNYTCFPGRPIKMMQPLEKFSNYKTSDWDDEIASAYKINGKRYGMNINGSNYSEYVVMYYNKTIFNKMKVKTPRQYWQAGNWNWDTFMECAKATTKKDKSVYGYVNLWAQSISYWTTTGGKDFISYDTNTSKFTSNIGNKTLSDSLTFFLTLTDKGYMDKTLPYGPDTFKAGKAAMFSCIAYQMFKDSNSRFDEMTDEIDAVPFPMPKGKQQVALMDASAFGILQGAKNPEGAIEFLKYFLDPRNYPKSDNFINANLKDTYGKVSQMKKLVPYTRGVLDGAGLVDYSPMSQLICKSDVGQVKATLEKYKSSYDISINKVNQMVSQAK